VVLIADFPPCKPWVRGDIVLHGDDAVARFTHTSSSRVNTEKQQPVKTHGDFVSSRR
jgi:hypothetical protein